MEGAQIKFDPTLVRGMGYYTGPIFEVECKGFSGAIAGGGRYDEMSGKYLSQTEPACGISIGFERILSIIQDGDFKIPNKQKKLAFLYPKSLPSNEYSELISQAANWRETGYTVILMEQNKNMNKQLNQLQQSGFEFFVKYSEGEVREIKA